MSRARALSLLGLAEHLEGAGQAAEAATCRTEAAELARAAADPSALNQVALALEGAGDLDGAHALLVAAHQLAPDRLEPAVNLGNLLRRLGRLEEARTVLEAVARAAPDHPALNHNLGLVLAELGRGPAALKALRRALDGVAGDQPAEAVVASDLGAVLKDLDRPAEALSLLRRAHALAPGDRRIATQLAGACLKALHVAEAVERFEALAASAPDDGPAEAGEAWSNLAAALIEANRAEDAIAAAGRALGLDPQAPGALFNRAVARLLAGDWAAGLPEYGWRWRGAGAARYGRAPDLPTWDGAPLAAGQSLWVRGEQGLGDHLMLARYLPLLADRVAPGGLVIECYPSLTRLLAVLPGLAGVPLAFGNPAAERPPPGAPAQIDLYDLPVHFPTTPEAVPGRVPYLAAPSPGPDWLAEVEALPRPRLGLVWAGKPRPRDRGLPLADLLAALDGLPGSRVALQTGPGRAELARLPAGRRPFDAGGRVGDLADTAAVMARLDRVVSIDTAAAHLAGGLGVPLDLLLIHGADWRWLRDRADSPLYPSARLFRQRKERDWEAPLRALRVHLAGRVTEDSPSIA
ncbi:tetratricopeptide repeat protein [Roseospirillum parvum]|uniref:Tetratricopeptide (TPR) repeat n=1 Tax=Roseospirillum parvum TaxID=83401 RepID=A0A1G8BQ86_9PROT|nr:tetratricopeptide repeat protein [Roseospirillum parvum]SDH35319.1 Tetratricopeptide (TPR) repeat [Roseospirillum parvum]